MYLYSCNDVDHIGKVYIRPVFKGHILNQSLALQDFIACVVQRSLLSVTCIAIAYRLNIFHRRFVKGKSCTSPSLRRVERKSYDIPIAFFPHTISQQHI